MLELSFLRENVELVIERLAIKRVDARETIKKILEADLNRRETQKLLDDNLAESNQIAREVGNLFKEGRQQEANDLKSRSAELKVAARDLTEKLDILQKEQHNLLVTLPNLPHPETPKGHLPEHNVTIYSEGEIPVLGEDAVPHWELTSKYDIIDFELGVKLTGAGFPVYKGQGARLQRALINFFVNEGVDAGYLEIQPPLMVNEASAYATGQLPDKDSQMYHVGLDNFYMIPTAEVQIFL